MRQTFACCALNVRFLVSRHVVGLPHEKNYQQLSARRGEDHVRHLLKGVREEQITTAHVAEELGVSQRWVQKLYSTYLAACAHGGDGQWHLGGSGGSHGKEVSAEIEELWRKFLRTKPPASYSFIASETLRRFAEHVDRATVRRWALRKKLAHDPRPSRDTDPVRRWQSDSVGALWQLDVTPHRWFGEQGEPRPLFDMLDDCSRVVTGSRLYPRECLLAYLDFLRRAFEAYGLPSCLYVDYHSMFFTAVPDTLTYLGSVLQWLGVSFKYAPTAKAKGKVERQHLFWQQRLPAYFAAEKIQDLDEANKHIHELRIHHNECEMHRELGQTPAAAWKQATRNGHSVLRPWKQTPWWAYLWSVRNQVKVSIDGTVLFGARRVHVGHSVGRRLTLCQHPDGSSTLLANELGVGKPIVVRRLEVPHPSWQI